MMFKNTQLITMVVLVFLQSCLTKKVSEQQFETFYKDAEYKFLDCIDFGLDRYYQNFDEKDCYLFLNSETEKRFVLNGINMDDRILNAYLKSTSFDSRIFCGYSKKYAGHHEKPIFDKTIYDVIASVDTSIIFKSDTLHCQVDIKKTTIVFKCRHKFFEVCIDIAISNFINIAQIDIDYKKRIRLGLDRIGEINKLDFIPIKQGDLLYHEGPLLSVFKDALSDNFYL